ncbi:hypothetical protein [Pedobacter cryoconitis]|uniref:Uncharacterized protein n=1 Tax=Pedobacter cryoconitis TaxID=188932 RepID=A0A327SRR1_9SPHI|nr:hypothetical protein [Pedobacter cryoconitis]RAJ30193.1 hypothetical protein LY11_02534 [Pedobacter cryoconitis]
MILSLLLSVILLFLISNESFSSTIKTEGIKHDPAAKIITITVPDKKLSIIIGYSKGCVIEKLVLNGNLLIFNIRGPQQIFRPAQAQVKMVLIR